MSASNQQKGDPSPHFISLPLNSEDKHKRLSPKKNHISVSIRSYKGNVMELSIPDTSSFYLPRLVSQFLEES